MKRYRVSPAARDDLKQISRYIAVERESSAGAGRLRAQFLESFRRLAQNPFLEKACPELGEDLRIWPVGNFVILYVPQANGIDIVQVAHGARDLPAVVRKPSVIHALWRIKRAEKSAAIRMVGPAALGERHDDDFVRHSAAGNPLRSRNSQSNSLNGRPRPASISSIAS